MGPRLGNGISPCFFTFLRGGVWQAIPKSFLFFGENFLLLVVHVTLTVAFWILQLFVVASLRLIPVVLSGIEHCMRPGVCMYRSVPHIRPPFCNLSASRKHRGAYMWDLTFYLTNTPPLPGPCLDVDIGTLYYRPLQKLVRQLHVHKIWPFYFCSALCSVFLHSSFHRHLLLIGLDWQHLSSKDM